jgi:hypothetical protein
MLTRIKDADVGVVVPVGRGVRWGSPGKQRVNFFTTRTSGVKELQIGVA